ncbi:MAG TPA: SPOR domain-containing protein, partial [Burkholderiales bacterium]|nr:SPOR domain-containing protein [Burkholderiales bacterium]
MNNKTNPINAPIGAPTPERLKQRANRRLLAALMLIGVAIGGLYLMERWRQQPAITAPPHEPAQALIAPPSPELPGEPAQAGHPAAPPPPPQVLNNEKLAEPAKPAPASPAAGAKISAKPAPAAGNAYVVQVGVFMSPANAQALHQQLLKAGIPAHTETRVQLGPFQDRREAE